MRTVRRVLPYFGPRLRIGIHIGRLARYTRHDLTILPLREFQSVRAPSLLWGMTRGDDGPSASVDKVLVPWIGQSVESLNKTTNRRRTVAVIDDQGHAYSTLLWAGRMSQDAMRKRYLAGDDAIVRTVREMLAFFAPSPRRDPAYLDLPWERSIEGHLQRRALTREEATPERLDMLQLRTALGSNIIERSHLRIYREGRFVVVQYLASTSGFDHGLDGYAEHRHIVDTETGDLYFQANGEGRHVVRTIDGLNNPLAPFVFSVMSCSFTAWLALLDQHATTGPGALDALADPRAAVLALEDHLWRTDRGLYAQRRVAWGLDLVSGLARTARLVLGGNVLGAPAELPKQTGAGGARGGNGGGGDGALRSMAVLPFVIMLVYLLDDRDKDKTEDEDDPDYSSIFVTLDDNNRPVGQQPAKVIADEEM